MSSESEAEYLTDISRCSEFYGKEKKMITFIMEKTFRDGRVIKIEVSDTYLTTDFKQTILEAKKLIQEQEENQEKS